MATIQERLRDGIPINEGIPLDELALTRNERLRVEAADALDAAEKALEKIVEMNVQYAIDRYGDAKQADTMSCVTVARAALSLARGDS